MREMKLWFSKRGYPKNSWIGTIKGWIFWNFSCHIQPFTSKHWYMFCSARKISSYLVQAKLYPLERSAGSFKCGAKCCEVFLNAKETETFFSTSTNETYKINCEFNCNESSLVYFLTCKISFKQCIGQTVDIFRNRWNNYDKVMTETI